LSIDNFFAGLRPEAPKVEACSTAMRAITSGGSTLSWYSRVWCSKMSQDGIETTREWMPSAISCSWACTTRQTSLPEAIRITSGFPPGASART